MDVKPLLQGLFHGTSFDKDSFGKPLDVGARPSDRPDPTVTGALPPVIPQDVFEKAPGADSQSQAATQPQAADGLKVSMHFDLFYQLSQKVTARMGQSGGKRFAEVASTVAETFKGNFSLTIDPIGSYLKGTDKSLDISPETANSFFNAVAGLADQSPQALEGFLKESDKLFNELEGKYGEAGGTFDELKKQVQDQATTFFQQVGAARDQMAGQSVDPTADQAALENVPPQPQPDLTASKDAAATQVVAGNNSMINSQGYQDFLKNFINYVQKFQKQSLLDFFKMSRRPGLASGESGPALPAPKPGLPEPKGQIGPSGAIDAQQQGLLSPTLQPTTGKESEVGEVPEASESSESSNQTTLNQPDKLA